MRRCVLDITSKKEKLVRCQKWRKNITEIDWEEVYVPVQSWDPGGPRKLIKVPPEEAVAIKKENERIDEIYAQGQKWITHLPEPIFLMESEKINEKIGAHSSETPRLYLVLFWLLIVILVLAAVSQCW